MQKVENKNEAPEKPAPERKSRRKQEKFSTDLRPRLDRLKGTPIDRLQEGGISSHSVFFGRADVAHDPHEAVCPSLCAEATGNLLLHLGESDAAFSLIVCKRYRPIRGKSQDVSFIVSEPFQQASGFPFRLATTLARGRFS